ncbi:ABC transporter ATP-binding protein [Roseibacterium sp. SDUM158017]|uniref:ABC transporter ATP-binding protein n=1 Tax=Roseicyclus salinarum TaxID=3036773 RepID=UPI0024155914|nr:ABC transporter ATP-binding protein [Roseibacterium sp. SDUM158017]MDG4647003.1 ABC transporter ATP-binding protein [Roseibacterium sp. SDUM158017]
MSETILELSDVTRRYPGGDGQVTVLSSVTLSISAGETVALTGESGSGKSTLMHLAGGLDAPDEGRVSLMGNDLSAMSDASRARVRGRHVGLVFQQFNLVPSLDVAANVAIQSRLSGRRDPALETRLMDRLGLSDFRGRYPEQLSGGQQQRVAIARALAARPDLILADEPTGNLDEATGDAVLQLLLELVGETGAGLLMVTHSERLAARLGRRLVLSRGRLVPHAPA